MEKKIASRLIIKDQSETVDPDFYQEQPAAVNNRYILTSKAKQRRRTRTRSSQTRSFFFFFKKGLFSYSDLEERSYSNIVTRPETVSKTLTPPSSSAHGDRFFLSLRYLHWSSLLYFFFQFRIYTFLSRKIGGFSEILSLGFFFFIINNICLVGEKLSRERRETSLRNNVLENIFHLLELNRAVRLQ